MSETEIPVPDAAPVVLPDAEGPRQRRGGRPRGTGRRPGRRATRTALHQHEEIEARDDSRAPEGERLRRQNLTENRFHIDQKDIPDGMSYEWKRTACYGQPDTFHQLQLRQNHWKPVPADRHPHLVPDKSGTTIQQDGMILMERPKYLTREAQEEGLMNAQDQVRSVSNRMQATPDNTMTRNHDSVRRNSYVKRSYEAGVIPED